MEKVDAENIQSNVIDISLAPIRKKRFRIDGDDDRILELNTSDLNILSRLKETYPKLVETANKAFTNLPDIDATPEDYDFQTDEATNSLVEALKQADAEMRQWIDFIFQSNVSELCAPSGSMYDPINGQFRFEFIIDTLATLYENDISSEMQQISARVQKHTAKYRRTKKK